ncbi:MAG: TonB C-terminal domain-containing protein [Burkholderiales bacterium]|nr:TonB C-terminal domain-containing protein [Burkholderiales bacterium]
MRSINHRHYHVKKMARWIEKSQLFLNLRIDAMAHVIRLAIATGALLALLAACNKAEPPAKISTPDPAYAPALMAKIKSNLNYAYQLETTEKSAVEMKISQRETGEVLAVTVLKSSGNPAYDLAVERAILKSSPLPRKKDGTVEAEFVAKFTVKE